VSEMANSEESTGLETNFKPADIQQYKSVKKWIESVNGGSDPTEMAEHINLLSEFCNFEHLDPDELILRCVRTLKDESKAISTKGRREIESAIKAFVANRNKTGREAIVEENKLRSFFVHNGIFMQGRAAIF